MERLPGSVAPRRNPNRMELRTLRRGSRAGPGRPRRRPGMDVEGRADAEQNWRLELNDMLRHPALLLGRTEADPHEVRFRAIDQLDDALVLLPRQGPKGRRVRSRHGQVREAPT